MHWDIEMKSRVHRNRSLFTVTFTDEDPLTGCFTEVSTNQGTSELIQLYPRLVASRAQVKTYLNYAKLEPYEGGCVFTGVTLVDTAGSMPALLTYRKTPNEALLKRPESFINFILKGYHF